MASWTGRGGIKLSGCFDGFFAGREDGSRGDAESAVNRSLAASWRLRESYLPMRGNQIGTIILDTAISFGAAYRKDGIVRTVNGL